mgnify:CR=1 FL=1
MEEIKIVEALLSSPSIISVLIILVFSITFLFRLLLKRTDDSQKRISELEKEFRDYIQKEGAQSRVILERATKAIEDLMNKLMS